jgi:proteasome lid subunit RPN8/RPN11
LITGPPFTQRISKDGSGETRKAYYESSADATEIKVSIDAEAERFSPWYNSITISRMDAQTKIRSICITEAVRLAIEAHALKSRPAECCGLLSGRVEVITEIHPLRNEAETPETRYFATPEDLFAAMRRIRESGQILLGVYHSHPRSPAHPSASDVEMAFYPEAFYFIISLEPRVELRAFKIEQSRIEDVEIMISQ